MADKPARRFIEGKVQWAGKNALPSPCHGTIARGLPKLMVYQSEQECGDGANNWSYTGYGWQLINHYFRRGVIPEVAECFGSHARRNLDIVASEEQAL